MEFLSCTGSLFKQATIGECNIPKPSVFSIEASAKWKAWDSLGDMSQASARRYDHLLKSNRTPHKHVLTKKRTFLSPLPSLLYCMVYGVWCMVYGVWCMVYGVWCMVSGPLLSPHPPPPPPQLLSVAPLFSCPRLALVGWLAGCTAVTSISRRPCTNTGTSRGRRRA
jgi:hypothetical protein